jgi:hypothetical protein
MRDEPATDVRRRAKLDLEAAGLIVTTAHVDYGHGYHGASYLDIPGLLYEPGRAWRLAQDLLGLVPASLRSQIDIVGGVGSVGVVMAHAMAGLLDSHRPREASGCGFMELAGQPARSSADHAPLARLRDRALLLVSEWSDPVCPLEAVRDAVRAAGGEVVARALLWGWPHPASESEGPVITLCDWIIQDRVAARQCPACSGVLVTARRA